MLRPSVAWRSCFWLCQMAPKRLSPELTDMDNTVFFLARCPSSTRADTVFLLVRCSSWSRGNLRMPFIRVLSEELCRFNTPLHDPSGITRFGLKRYLSCGRYRAATFSAFSSTVGSWLPSVTHQTHQRHSFYFCRLCLPALMRRRGNLFLLIPPLL